MNNYYNFLAVEKNEQTISATLSLNAAHDLFKGHFPDNPILPGVCQLQLITELAENSLAKKLLLSEAASMKFIAVINPITTPQFSIKADYLHSADILTVKAHLFSNDIIFSKFNLTFAAI